MRNGPAYIGDLRSHTVECDGTRYNVATLMNVASPAAGSTIPDLYEPVLVAFTVLAVRLRGYERIERHGGSIGVVQEWHCELP